MKVPPMLVMGAQDDALFTPTMIRETAESYHAELIMLPELAHAIMLECKWRVAADALADWLAREPAAGLAA